MRAGTRVKDGPIALPPMLALGPANAFRGAERSKPGSRVSAASDPAIRAWAGRSSVASGPSDEGLVGRLRGASYAREPRPEWASDQAGGRIVAPGVRMGALPPKKAKSKRPDPERQPRVPAVPPSRADRPDLVPSRGPAPAPGRYDGLEGAALVAALRASAEDKQHLGYRPAREAMFRFIDRKGGTVEDVYTGHRVRTDRIPSADGPNGMNTEHGWPQSKGVRGTEARSDLHHLFPTLSSTNSRRSNHPFGEVMKGLRWEEGGSKLGRDAHGTVVFEPRDLKKGDIARALFYVSVLYQLPLPIKEERVLRAWHEQDPPSPDERARNAAIAEFQGNRNFFVDHPDLVARIPRFDGR